MRKISDFDETEPIVNNISNYIDTKNLNISQIFAYRVGDGLIGVNNQLPWHLPADLKFFKDMTINCIVIYGKNTYNSLPKNYLPNRINIVISKSLFKEKQNNNNSNLIKIFKGIETCRELAGSATITEIYFVSSIEDSMRLSIALCNENNNKNIFFIGGTKILEESLQYVNKIYLTQVKYDSDAIDNIDFKYKVRLPLKYQAKIGITNYTENDSTIQPEFECVKISDGGAFKEYQVPNSSNVIKYRFQTLLRTRKIKY